jgi:hypothetical protein
LTSSHRITGCRACGGRNLHLVLDLGRTALANRFISADQLTEPEPTFPLRLVLCGGCGLVQIDETVPPRTLFQNYVYVTGTSDLAVRHAAALARRLTERYELTPDDLVLEAASNDGTVLKAFAKQGVRTLGVEPAVNIMARALHDGIDTIGAYFGESTGRYCRERSGPARLFLARHVLAHVPDLHGFLRGAAAALADDGVAVVEAPYLLPFFQNVEYDTVYHEHLCYFSVGVLQRLAAMCGLHLIDVEEVAIHGGSILVTMQRQGGPHPVSRAVGRFLERETEVGLDQPEPWAAFARQVAVSREQLLAELDRLQRQGKRVAGYGAAAKGMQLLAYCGIGPERLPYVVDRNPLKQGLFTPGHHIPVFGPERLLADRPDVVLILAWNFAAEVIEQQAEYRRRGGRFLVPLPEPRYAEERPARLKVA